MYQCVSVIKAKPEGLQTLIDEASKLVEITRKEEGLIYYNLLQSTDDENTIVLVEKWETMENFLAHVAHVEEPGDPVGRFGGIVEANAEGSSIYNLKVLV